MKYPPHEARVVFVDGPVAIYLHEASKEELEAALARIRTLVGVALPQLVEAHLRKETA